MKRDRAQLSPNSCSAQEPGSSLIPEAPEAALAGAAALGRWIAGGAGLQAASAAERLWVQRRSGRTLVSEQVVGEIE
jgi:anti-sigma factor RsiW